MNFLDLLLAFLIMLIFLDIAFIAKVWRGFVSLILVIVTFALIQDKTYVGDIDTWVKHIYLLGSYIFSLLFANLVLKKLES